MTIKQKILSWIETDISLPNELLGGLPPCPFARKAVIDKKVFIVEYDGLYVYSFIDRILNGWTGNYDMVLCALVNKDVVVSDMMIEAINAVYNKQDFVILFGDPKKPFIINGVTTTFPLCPLVYMQPLSAIKKASEELKKTLYYSFWTKEQMDKIVSWR